MLGFCRLKIEGDIEANEKKLIAPKVINCRFSRLKIQPQSNKNYSALMGPTRILMNISDFR